MIVTDRAFCIDLTKKVVTAAYFTDALLCSALHGNEDFLLSDQQLKPLYGHWHYIQLYILYSHYCKHWAYELRTERLPQLFSTEFSGMAYGTDGTQQKIRNQKSDLKYHS